MVFNRIALCGLVAISILISCTSYVPVLPDQENAKNTGTVSNCEEAEWLYRRGVDLGKQGRHEDALSTFQETAELCPQFSEIHRVIGYALQNLRRLEESEKAYRQAIKLDPSFSAAYINLASVLNQMWRFEEALEVYNQAAEIDPDLALAWVEIKDHSSEMLSHKVISSQRIDILGFSCLPPQGNMWFVLNQSDRSVDFIRGSLKGEYHTVIAFAELEELTQEIRDREEIIRYVEEQVKIGFSTQRHKLIDYKITPEDLYNTESIRLRFVVEDSGVPYSSSTVFEMWGEEIYILHPSIPQKHLVRVGYSQRFLPGENPLLIDQELEPFLKSIVFTAFDTFVKP